MTRPLRGQCRRQLTEASRRTIQHTLGRAIRMSNPSATRSSHLAALLLFAASAIGCAAPLTTALTGAANKQEPTPTPAETQAAEALKAQALHKATVGEEIPEDKAFAKVADKLQEIRAIDPEAERELVGYLKAAKP
jgi:hypothetical protein